MIWEVKEVLKVNILARKSSYYFLFSLPWVIFIKISGSWLPLWYPCCLFHSLFFWMRDTLVDSSSKRGGAEKRRGRERGCLLKYNLAWQREEGKRLVGETEKQASCVSNEDLVTLSFSFVSLLTRLTLPVVLSSLWLESYFESVYLLQSLSLLSFFSVFLSSPFLVSLSVGGNPTAASY